MTDQQFVTFEDGVIICQSIEDFWNSPNSDQEIISLAKRFNLQIRDDFVVKTKEIRKNCPECMGCENETCTLGCFNSDTDVVCLWDVALEEVIGTKLILHEYGHVIYEQIFINDLSEEEAFEQSEEFAQFLEDNYTIAWEFCQGCNENQIQAKIMRKGIFLTKSLHPEFHLPDPEGITGMSGGEMKSEAFRGLIAGFSLAVGAAIFAVLINRAFGQEKASIVG